MPLEYDQDTRLDDLVIVINEYTDWFIQITRRLQYPEHHQDTQFSYPLSFGDWTEKSREESVLEEGTINRINDLHGDLKKRADTLINDTLKSGARPSFEDFDKLTTFFEEFINHIRRLERDILTENSGLDPLTGLRNMSHFEKDIKREIERFVRQGKPFVLAVVRIDDFDRIKDTQPDDIVEKCLIVVSGLIKQTVRSFDDAYRLDNDEFVLSLKHASTTGGVKALERLRDDTLAENITFKIDGETVPLSLSSCITTPLPNDDVGQLMKHIRGDLDWQSEQSRKGVVLEHAEISPLERYIKQTD